MAASSGIFLYVYEATDALSPRHGSVEPLESATGSAGVDSPSIVKSGKALVARTPAFNMSRRESGGVPGSRRSSRENVPAIFEVEVLLLIEVLLRVFAAAL
jgi:hypothetical protein